MASPPDPLVDAHRLYASHGREQSPPYQAKQGGRTGRQRQAGREPGPGVPPESHADRPEGGDQPTSFPHICGH
jgi:hypothetical protein